VVGLVAFLVIAIAGLTWAKWNPYLHRAMTVAATHQLGASILSGSRLAPPEPSIGAAIDYALSYFRAIWTALVAGLLVAAATETLIPRRWLLRVMSGRGQLGGVVAGLLAVPCMMCTCCSAPATVSLRRIGTPVGSALAWWVGNPAINPAVIVFAAFVLPWQWVVLRLVAGILLVFVVVGLVARLSRSDRVDVATAAEGLGDLGPRGLGDAVGRYARSLGRLSVTLLPEYLVIVLLLGAFRGWLFPVAHGISAWGPLAVLLFAVAGTLFVIPTAGEIPIVQGMLKAGIGVAPSAALLITLPSISLPSLAMVWRSFPPRVSIALAGSVALLGLLTALAASLLISA
jgi:uncharacterized membrane protein YraQ (UPF0718 family)